MNIVGFRIDNSGIFESHSFTSEAQKQEVIKAIMQDAVGAEIEIRITEMSSEELESILSQ